MSMAACKVVVDWYAALGAEAAGLYVIADRNGYSALAAEAFALWEGAKGICEAGSEMADYLTANSTPANDAFVKELVDMAINACDWAKTTRKWTDRVAAKEKLAEDVVDRWIAEMRTWRDDGAALVRGIANSQMGSAG